MGSLYTEFPQETTTHRPPRSNGHQGGEPPDPATDKEQNPLLGEALLGYLKQPPPSPHGSFQADMADITAHSSHTLSSDTPERDTSPTLLPLLAHSINLLDNILHLQEEMNEALVHLLSARTTMETCHQQIISETEVGHCQNKIDTSKAI